MLYQKFIVRVIISLIVLGFGIAIFFVYPAKDAVGLNLVTLIAGMWVSVGSAKNKSNDSTEEPTTLELDQESENSTQDDTIIPMTIPVPVATNTLIESSEEE